MSVDYSEKLANSIKRMLDDYNVDYYFNDEMGKFEFALDCEKFRLKHIRMIILVLNEGFRVYGTPDLSIDMEDLRTLNRVNEYICRANDDSGNGLFTIFFSSGLIAFKVYIRCSSQNITSSDFIYAIFLPLSMFEGFGNGLLDVIYSNVNVESAYIAAKRENNLN